MFYAGIDIGSISAKAALIKDGELIATEVIRSGYNSGKSSVLLFERLLERAGVCKEDVKKIVSTGYGRNSVLFADKSITEITCHAKGACFLDPSIRSVIDIGGQDSKAILMDSSGNVKNFAMNDKCAAGTGRFLEVMARAMELDLDSFGDLSMKADNPAMISSVCTVFAESEVISLVSRGEKRRNIIAGIHEAIASRVSAMAKRVGVTSPVMMTGGVAHNSGVVKAFVKRLQTPVIVSEYAQLTGAVGAAIIASNLSI